MQIMKISKSITTREIIRIHPEAMAQLWGGEFWTNRFYVKSISKFGYETTISKYLRNQEVEKDYTILQKSNNWICFHIL